MFLSVLFIFLEPATPKIRSIKIKNTSIILKADCASECAYVCVCGLCVCVWCMCACVFAIHVFVTSSLQGHRFELEYTDM